MRNELQVGRIPLNDGSPLHYEFLDLKKPAADAETDRLQVTKLYLGLESLSRGLRG